MRFVVQTSDGYEWFDELEHASRKDAEEHTTEVRAAIDADETGAVDVRIIERNPSELYAVRETENPEGFRDAETWSTVATFGTRADAERFASERLAGYAARGVYVRHPHLTVRVEQW